MKLTKDLEIEINLKETNQVISQNHKLKKQTQKMIISLEKELKNRIQKLLVKKNQENKETE